jgi:hypothetical protein
MNRSLFVGGVVLAIAALCSTVGCTSAVQGEDDIEAVSTEDALGRDPGNCYFHHRLRRWHTQCTYGNATYQQRSAIENAATHASGIGACAEFVVTAAGAAAGTVTVVLTPASIGAAALAAGSAAGCGLYITDILRNIIPTSCVTWEVTPTDRERTDRCAMACGGTERVYDGDCYCGRVPLACTDAPRPTGTPTPATCGSTSTTDGCFGTSACPLTGAGRANCSGTAYASRGARTLNVEGTKFYSCTAAGWRACS